MSETQTAPNTFMPSPHVKTGEPTGPCQVPAPPKNLNLKCVSRRESGEMTLLWRKWCLFPLPWSLEPQCYPLIKDWR